MINTNLNLLKNKLLLDFIIILRISSFYSYISEYTFENDSL